MLVSCPYVCSYTEMPNNWMWSAVDQTLLGLRGFPLPPWANIRAFFFLFSFWYCKFCWIFQNFSNSFEFTLGKNKKVPCFPNFFGRRTTEKTLARIRWKTQLACLLHGCCFLKRTHLLDCRGTSPNSKQLQKLKWQNFSANMLMCAELKQKVRLFLLFEGTSPLEPRKSLKKLRILCQFFFIKNKPYTNRFFENQIQILKVSLWENLYKDFFIWIFHCRVNGKHSKERERTFNGNMDCVHYFMRLVSSDIFLTAYLEVTCKIEKSFDFFYKWIFFLRIFFPPISAFFF